MRLSSFVAHLARPPLPIVAVADTATLGHAAAVSPLEHRATDHEPAMPPLPIEEFVHLARLAGAL